MQHFLHWQIVGRFFALTNWGLANNRGAWCLLSEHIQHCEECQTNTAGPVLVAAWSAFPQVVHWKARAGQVTMILSKVVSPYLRRVQSVAPLLHWMTWQTNQWETAKPMPAGSPSTQRRSSLALQRCLGLPLTSSLAHSWWSCAMCGTLDSFQQLATLPRWVERWLENH